MRNLKKPTGCLENFTLIRSDLKLMISVLMVIYFNFINSLLNLFNKKG